MTENDDDYDEMVKMCERALAETRASRRAVVELRTLLLDGVEIMRRVDCVEYEMMDEFERMLVDRWPDLAIPY